MNKIKKLMSGMAILLTLPSLAQDSLSGQRTTPLTFSGFAEIYYSYDFGKPADSRRPAFFYSHNRHNEFNVNLAFLKGSYNTDRIRGNIALATGTYMEANYKAEPGVLKNIYEANVGVKILKDKSLWIDAGIFSSHIGFESAYSPDCWTLTRSIMAENSPYFESGAKVTYTPDNGKWLLSALALNGWQRIQRIPGNSLMSWGTQVQAKLSDKILLNYSTFFGTDEPDSLRLWRYFHDIYASFQFTDQWGLIVGFDLGLEQVSKGSRSMNTWFSPDAILRYELNDKWTIAARCEYYHDRAGVIISTGTPHGFKTFGASLNVDRIVAKNFLWRTEIRTLKSRDAIFIKRERARDNNTVITTSVTLLF